MLQTCTHIYIRRVERQYMHDPIATIYRQNKYANSMRNENNENVVHRMEEEEEEEEEGKWNGGRFSQASLNEKLFHEAAWWKWRRASVRHEFCQSS